MAEKKIMSLAGGFDLSETVSENQIKLNILSRLKPGSRLVTEGQGLSIEGESRGYFFIPRWLRGESRERALTRVQHIIAQSCEISNALLYRMSNASDDLQVRQQLATYEREFATAIKGLENLQKTYQDDCQFQSHIEHLIIKINNQLALLRSRSSSSLVKPPS